MFLPANLRKQAGLLGEDGRAGAPVDEQGLCHAGGQVGRALDGQDLFKIEQENKPSAPGGCLQAVGLAAGDEEHIPGGQLEALAGNGDQIAALDGHDQLAGAVPVGVVGEHGVVVPEPQAGIGLELDGFQIAGDGADVVDLALPQEKLVDDLLVDGMGNGGLYCLRHNRSSVGVVRRVYANIAKKKPEKNWLKLPILADGVPTMLSNLQEILYHILTTLAICNRIFCKKMNIL